MRRRAIRRFLVHALLFATCMTALVFPLMSAAQQKVYRIGYLANQPDPRATSSSFRAFVETLQRHGWKEGGNLEIRILSSGGDDERFQELAGTLVRENVDVIVTTGAASTRAAKAATNRIPIVFGSSANPVEQNFVASLARPGGNVTGSAVLVQELGPKRLQLLKEIVPKASRVAHIYTKLTIGELQPTIARAYDAAARALGMTVDHMRVDSADSIDATMAAASRSGADAVMMDADPLFIVNRQQIAATALKYKLAMIAPDGRFVEAGALMSYGEDFAALYRRGAFLVDKILRGANPADLPVEQPSLFHTTVNLKTAKTLGVTIPQSIVIQADRVFR